MARPPPAPSQPGADPLIGQVIEDRWRVLERVGAGAMGVVYRAERIKLGKHVAVKVLHEGYARSRDFIARFEREARAISRLDHIHCVSILDFGVHGRRPYIVMEFITGRRLTLEIGKAQTTPTRACALIRQILLGLRHAHNSGVLHRDLKPDNVMLTEVTGTGDLVKILDFGFAHIIDAGDPSLTDKQIVAGTPSYMSPEQASGHKTDLRTDLYSTAVMLYELCVGQKPFQAEDLMQVLSMHIHKPPPRPREVAPERNISPELEAVILRGLAKKREERYDDAEAFREALDATPEGQEASRPKLSRLPSEEAAPLSEADIVETGRSKVREGARRRRSGLGAFAVIAFVLAGVGGAMLARTYIWPPREGVASPASSELASSSATATLPAGGHEEVAPGEPRPSEPKPAEPKPAEPSEPPPRLLEPRQQAESLIAAGKLDEAERILLPERRANPQSTWVRMDLAEIYFRRMWRRDAVREWDEALKIEPSLRHDKNLQQHICAALDQRTGAEAEKLLLTRFGQSAVGVMNQCIRTTKERDVLANAVKVIEKVAGPARVDRGIVAVRELELAPSCDDKRRAVENVARLRERRALGALSKLEKARLDGNGRPRPGYECLGRLVIETIRGLR